MKKVLISLGIIFVICVIVGVCFYIHMNNAYVESMNTTGNILNDIMTISLD